MDYSTDSSDSPAAGAVDQLPLNGAVEAEYMLESEAKCPGCGATIEALQVVRVLRTRVNFVSSLPRRGQLMVCPQCRTILAGSLGGII
ncbi:MAG: hypothetical protein OEM62_00645 [Acidobacteriota bacterium]|nr:hypothetical protein [Acidobacteriota bacterium]